MVGDSRPLVWSMLNMETVEPLLLPAETYRNLPAGSTVKNPGSEIAWPGIIVVTAAGVVGVNTPVVWLMVNMETELSSVFAV